jgi:hypothetical protein
MKNDIRVKKKRQTQIDEAKEVKPKMSGRKLRNLCKLVRVVEAEEA